MYYKTICIAGLALLLAACDAPQEQAEKTQLKMEVYETAASGHKMKSLTEFPSDQAAKSIEILPDQKFQTITGFGGSFTEASAHLLNRLSKENRDKIIDAYFGEEGARYSLTRTHINSCD
ncbi:MAG: glycosyl hydrolase family 30, partial [Bacteroidota bacterium]